MKDSLSIFWNRFILIVLTTELAFLLFYTVAAFYFFRTNQDLLNGFTFNTFRQHLLDFLPYLIEMNAFFTGLWAYLWLIELDNKGFHHEIKPAGTFIWFIIPVLNLFAAGIMFSKIINKADDKWNIDRFNDLSKKLKNSLVMFYAGLMGIVFTYGLSSTLPYNDKSMLTNSFQLFQLLFTALIVLTLLGLLKLLTSANSFSIRASKVDNTQSGK